MQKTKSETRIHLISKAMAILQKYQAQNEWLPQISSQKMNTYLKEIGKLVELNEPVRIVRYQGAKRIEDRGPKWEYLTSHVARRTFVTLSLEKGMRPEVVMSITGHRSFKTMKKYIALNENGRKEDMDKVWG
jgi:integrase